MILLVLAERRRSPAPSSTAPAPTSRCSCSTSFLVPFELVRRIYGERSEVMPDVATAAVWASWAIWTDRSAALIARLRYQRLEVVK